MAEQLLCPEACRTKRPARYACCISTTSSTCQAITLWLEVAAVIALQQPPLTMHAAGDVSREEARWAQLQAARSGAPPAQLAGAYQRAVETHRSQAQVRAATLQEPRTLVYTGVDTCSADMGHVHALPLTAWCSLGTAAVCATIGFC